MQYFIGYSNYSDAPVFDPSLFVDLRNRLGAEQINEMNETIMGLVHTESDELDEKDMENKEVINKEEPTELITLKPEDVNQLDTKNKGELIVDATACPQDIAYPTDLNLLNDARLKSQLLIDILYDKLKLADTKIDKPRTYRKIARKEYLKVAQKKHKNKKEIRNANNLVTFIEI